MDDTKSYFYLNVICGSLTHLFTFQSLDSPALHVKFALPVKNMLQWVLLLDKIICFDKWQKRNHFFTRNANFTPNRPPEALNKKLKIVENENMYWWSRAEQSRDECDRVNSEWAQTLCRSAQSLQSEKDVSWKAPPTPSRRVPISHPRQSPRTPAAA